MSKRVAVIDVGSNTIKILVAQASQQNTLELLHHQVAECRLSTGIGEIGKWKLTQKSMEKGAQAIRTLQDSAAPFSPDQSIIVATSAVRDASNQKEFQDIVQQETGLHLAILSGKEEAIGIAQGALCDPALDQINDFVLMDLGGGSLELVHVTNRTALQAVSLPLGAVRMAEKFITDPKAPHSANLLQQIGTFAISELRESGFTIPPTALPLVGAGGSFSIARAVFASRANKKPEEREPTLKLKDLRAFREELEKMTLAERCQIPYLPENRADILPTALAIIDAIAVTLHSTQVLHTHYSLRYGIAASMLTEES